ncbi:MAG: hypothetical protein JW983_03845 [Elusimicrobia bacterium]|nr:hypothetical protein [Elusimicrobiota bacterium]
MRKILITLRIASFILLVLLIFQPTKKVYKKRDIPTVAVLVDNSKSMETISSSGFGNIKKKLTSQLTRNRNADSHLFAFSADVKKLQEKEIRTLKATGSRTDIIGALDKVKSDFLGRELDAVILFSDGNQNVNTDEGQVLEELKDLKIPVYTVIPERSDTKKNISVSGVDIPDILFRNTPAAITAKINTAGFAGQKISVYLKSDDTAPQVLQTKTLDIKNDGSFEIQFSVTPDRAGILNYSVSIPTYKGEKKPSDNTKKFAMVVEPEKIRIMYLCGLPSFNYSFLRNTLKNDPNIELVSFVILRNPENIVPVSDSELSLIPFPIHEIFSKEIFNFDMLIFDNFMYSRFPINQQYLTNIKNFVTEYGKAFVAIFGDTDLSPYKNTPIEEILPVTPASGIIHKKFRLNILQKEHNIFKLSFDPAENTSILENMPEFDGLNISTAKKESIVLAESKESKHPIITIAEQGKGRVMCITTSSLWRIALGSENPYNYVNFWSQSVKWLTNAASMKRVAIFTKKSYNIGDNAPVKIKVRDEYFKPVNNATVSLDVTLPDGKRESFAVSPEIENGEYAAHIPLDSSGEYKLYARAYYNKRFLGNDNAFLTVFNVSKESEDIFVNDLLMTKISETTGGKSMPVSSFDFAELKIKPRPTKRTRSNILYEVNIWNKPLMYIILLILLCTEWFLRRRIGLS